MGTKTNIGNTGGTEPNPVIQVDPNSFRLVKEYMLDRLSTELPKGLYYHGYHHTIDVMQACQDIARLEGLDETAVLLIKTAALFHDAGYITNPKNHEKAGKDMAKKLLPGFGYGKTEITLVAGMIMATKMPQSPSNIYERIICDADLDYLGREDYYPISDSLKTELEEKGIKLEENEWGRKQIKFLLEHSYFTETSKKLRGSAKQERLAELIHKTKPDGFI